MFYQSDRMKLERIRVVMQGPVNDVYICRDCHTKGETAYTLIVIKDHRTAKEYLEIFELSGKRSKEAYVESFSDQGNFCMVFAYRRERPLKSFYMGNSYSLEESEKVCTELILNCMSSSLPFPILYLVLTQGQIHLAQDNSIYFGYQFNLEELDPAKTEKDCVLACAGILKGLLATKSLSKGFTVKVLEKKIARESYRHFAELYKDVKLTAAPKKQKGIVKRFLYQLRKHQQRLTRILFIVCVLAAILAVLSLISQLLFGEVAWLRLIVNGFKIIGTQSLEQ